VFIAYGINIDANYAKKSVKIPRKLLSPYLYNRLLYSVSHEERSIFWEVIASVILSKKLCMNMCPIPNGFPDRDISLYSKYTVHTTDEQHAMSSHELQSAMMLLMKFFEMCCTR
jgi:hypothetical protein